MFTDHHSVSRMIGMQELAQLQVPPIPKNTCYCILPCSQLASTPGAMFSECRTPTNCKHRSSAVPRTPTFLFHYPGTHKTTMARVQARPTTLYQTACCASIGRSVPAPGNPPCRISYVNRLHGRLPLHSRAQCRLICRYGMGDHPCRVPRY